jgi:phytoene dehydrogenase-like protein
MGRTAIIGGGMAGIACARSLEAAGMDWALFECSDRLGGRVRTDLVDGFRLDRGFQVYLTAYRNVGEAIDEPALRLRAFVPGAMVFDGRGFGRISHPLRHPVAAARAVLSRPSQALDLARLAPMALAAMRSTADEPGPSEGTTEDLLRRMDLGIGTVDGFLRSFFGGVFLDRSLRTDASQFRFTFANFARGDAAVPALGMGELPLQLAASLPASRIHLGTRVGAVARRGGRMRVQTADGMDHEFAAVVLATDMASAHALDERVPDRAWQSTATMHWACAADRVPNAMREPILFLDGTGDGPVNHAACMTAAAPEYAPHGQALVSLNLVDPRWQSESATVLVARVVAQMERWFGVGAMRGWHLLRTDRVVRALPRQHPADLARRPAPELDDGLVVAGDHVTDASIDGAYRSGLRAAETVRSMLTRGSTPA